MDSYIDSNLISNITSITALVILMLLGTFFSASEMAFTSINRARMKGIAEQNGKRGKRAAKITNLFENYFDEVISTLLICNNLVAIAAATVSVALFVRLIGEWGYFVSTVVISAIVIVLTDIFPKTFAKQSPENVMIASVPTIIFLMTILKPINWAIVKMKDGLGAKFATDDEETPEDEQALLEQEIILMVEEAEKDGNMDEEDSTLITNAIEFNELHTWDIITPRVEMVSVPITADKDHIMQQFLESGYSRLPVYEESLDNIRGIIHVRDFLRYLATAEKSDAGDLQIESILTPAVYTVTSAFLKDLLKLMKEVKSHIAIVIDEYGGTEGIVTMDDILERLVGDIWDENDEVVEEFASLGRNKHKILCTAYINDMFDYFGIKAESESNTVGGWIMDELRRIPAKGDMFEFENLKVRITKADERMAIECIVEVITAEESPPQSK